MLSPEIIVFGFFRKSNFNRIFFTPLLPTQTRNCSAIPYHREVQLSALGEPKRQLRNFKSHSSSWLFKKQLRYWRKIQVCWLERLAATYPRFERHLEGAYLAAECETEPENLLWLWNGSWWNRKYRLIIAKRTFVKIGENFCFYFRISSREHQVL